MSLDDRMRRATHGVDATLGNTEVPDMSELQRYGRRQTLTRSATALAAVGVIVVTIAVVVAPFRGSTNSGISHSPRPSNTDVGPYVVNQVDPSDPHNLQSHWHAALGVYDCNHWMGDSTGAGVWNWPAQTPTGNPARASNTNVYAGLHSHDDGIMHMEPLTAGEAGANATVGLYFEYGGWKLSSDGFTFLGTTVHNGEACNGTPGTLQWWVNGKQKSGDPASYKLFDNDIVVIAFAPAGRAYPDNPPSVANLPDARNNDTTPRPGVKVPVIHLTVAPQGNLSFSPQSQAVKTGIYRLEISVKTAGHTLMFDDASVGLSQQSFTQVGTYSKLVNFSKPGDYTFKCVIPGHDAAGMHGVVHVVAAH